MPSNVVNFPGIDLDSLPGEDRAEVARLTLALEGIELTERGQFAEFCRQAWHVLEPQTPLKWNWHLSAMAAYLESYAYRDIIRLILNIAPGGMKSLMVSVFLPAWCWAKWPGRRFINLTNEKGLAIRDNRRMRDLVTSDWYRARWDRVYYMSTDVSGAELFENDEKGFRQGLGITGNISGKRGTDLLIDDPIDTKKAFSDVEIQTVNTTYDQAVSSRLNDFETDGICLIMQRTRTNDLTGHILAKKNQHWVQFKVAMEYQGSPGYDPLKDLGTTKYDGIDIRDPRRKVGALMFPERFSARAIAAWKEDLGDYGTAGQLNQSPSPLGGGILKKNWWKVWGKVKWTEGRKPPIIKHVFASMDTAYTKVDLKENAYTAVTAWGVFWDEERERDAIIMLWRWYERVDYPDLKKKTKDMVKPLGMTEGDAYLIEDKASGQSLLQDLQRLHRTSNTGIQVRGYDPKPDGDKVARAYLTQPMLKSGLLWIPDKLWAHEVVDIVGEFPAGAPPCADLTDTITQAAIYLKRGHWLVHPDDYTPEEEEQAVAEEDSWRHEDEQQHRRVGY